VYVIGSADGHILHTLADVDGAGVGSPAITPPAKKELLTRWSIQMDKMDSEINILFDSAIGGAMCQWTSYIDGSTSSLRVLCRFRL
jgi:hypothetical protein